jgi:hypothetical protein
LTRLRGGFSSLTHSIFYARKKRSARFTRISTAINNFCRWLQKAIAELEPRDLIDVHSFMWHMAPTGKWSDD